MSVWIYLLPLLQSVLCFPARAADTSDFNLKSSNSLNPVFLTGDRSTIEIIWTSLTIVFASTWVCIHPNVPGYNTTRLERFGLRGRFFLNALLFPDHFVKLAFEQWMGCRKLYSKVEERARQEHLEILPKTLRDGKLAWTLVHAHFIQMGGIAFRRRSGSSDDRWYEDFDNWSNADIRRFFDLEMTADEIEDLSKADGLAKAFVVIQCLWFVIQCVARAVYGLPIVGLEVTCLAFIACNLGMYGFWWDKPLNVMYPVTIDRPPPMPRDQGNESHRKAANLRQWMFALISTLWTGDIGYLIHPAEANNGDFEVIDNAAASFPASYFYTSGGTSDANLYEEWGARTWLVYSVSPAVFGALHSFAWYSHFPSGTERLLWRISCIVPVVHALLWITGVLLESQSRKLSCSQPMRGTCHILSRALAYFYFLISNSVNLAARLVFIVLPLLQLRDLPPLVHESVPRSDFLPHV
ncbi:hypothetical protein NMY22_g2060 [Coprinellus aureogranulatus]|nr:hypothetical protein NMY22_g2060 [Coprinellus aureogranulatus]